MRIFARSLVGKFADPEKRVLDTTGENRTGADGKRIVSGEPQ